MSGPDPTPATVQPPPLNRGTLPREPLLAAGGWATAAGALITALVAFGLHISHDQQVAVLGLIATVGPIVFALVSRRGVYAPETVRQLLLQRDRKPLP